MAKSKKVKAILKSKSRPAIRIVTGVAVIKQNKQQYIAKIENRKVVYKEKLKTNGYRNTKEDRELAGRIYKANGTFNPNVKRVVGNGQFVVYEESYNDKSAVQKFNKLRKDYADNKKYKRDKNLSAPEGKQDLRKFLLEQKFPFKQKRKKTIFDRRKDAYGQVYGRQNRTVQIICTIKYRVGRSKKILETTRSSNKIGSAGVPDQKAAREQALTRALQSMSGNNDSGYDGADTKTMRKYNAGVIDIVDVQWGQRRYDNK
jgi:hypothetical protein